jgi:putative phosphoribosyl transferase
MRFTDRVDAGKRLGERLAAETWHEPVVVGLPRGGVPVAREVALALGAPLDVLVARKLGAPGQPELGIGAIAEGGVAVLDREGVQRLGLTDADLSRIERREQVELRRRVEAYRGGRPLAAVAGRDVIVVDDGLATGVTAQAALLALRPLEPRSLVLAVPVGSPDTVARLSEVADDVVCLSTPGNLGAVGLWYDRFAQTPDEEVRTILRTSRHLDPTGRGGDGPAPA